MLLLSWTNWPVWKGGAISSSAALPCQRTTEPGMLTAALPQRSMEWRTPMAGRLWIRTQSPAAKPKETRSRVVAGSRNGPWIPWTRTKTWPAEDGSMPTMLPSGTSILLSGPEFLGFLDRTMSPTWRESLSRPQSVGLGWAIFVVQLVSVTLSSMQLPIKSKAGDLIPQHGKENQMELQ